MEYVLDYPVWFLGLCVLLGALYAGILYFRERKLEGTPTWLIYSLGGSRFIVVTLLAVLLLGPLIRNQTEEIEKPIIVIGHDNSASILLNKDSSVYKTGYLQDFSQLVDRLAESYRVELYQFGTELTREAPLDFKDKQSDLSLFFDEIRSRYYGRNIGAVIMASDGIYNKGTDPLFAASGIRNTGIYTIALGDTTVQRDLILEKVEHNRVAYLGNEFPVEVLVKADKLKGKTTQLRIIHEGKTIDSRPVQIDQSAFLKPFVFRIEADKPGLQKYIIRLTTVEGEFSETNNQQTIFVDVQNNRQKILIVGNAPHPDIGAIKNAIEKNKGYETNVVFGGDNLPSLNEYGLIILHQMPSTRFAVQALLTDLENSGKPALFVLGSNSLYRSFNNLQTGVSHIGYRGMIDPRNSALNENFSLFTLSSQVKESIAALPVVHVPFGTFKTGPSVEILLKQVIGGGVTNDPMIAFNRWNQVRTGFICGEGIWRWKLAFPDVFDEIIQKTVQYLATKEDKRYFRILGKREFNENEDVIFEAEVFNQSYELINDPSVSISIRNEQGEDLPSYNFATVGRSYQLNMGKLPVGRYTYVAKTSVSGNVYEVSGEFLVNPVVIEFANSVANHQLLHNIAHQNGGSMFFSDQLDDLYNEVVNRDDLLPVRHVQSRYTELIEWKWLFFLLVALLSLEWFFRKRNGAY